MFIIFGAFDIHAKADLVLYRKGTEKVIAQIPFETDPYGGCVRSAQVSGWEKTQIEYNFLVDGKIMQDPRAEVIRGRNGFGAEREDPGHEFIRCGFLQENFDWKDDTAPLHLPDTKIISYALHVRGFTRHKSSKVRHKGTFRGLMEKIPYLNDLGINQVILMPAYEFEEIDHRFKVNYWGYGPAWFFAPKASYAAGKDPDTECREMVRALHTAGIEVIMEFAFPNGTDFSYMTDCLVHWVRQYHIDGFYLRVSPESAAAIAMDSRLSGIRLICGQIRQDLLRDRWLPGCDAHLVMADEGFKTDVRRILKSDGAMLAAFTDRMKQGETGYRVYNYITSHDGFTLMDLVSYDHKHNEANGQQGQDGPEFEYSWNCGVEGPSRKKSIQTLRLTQMKNAFTALLTAFGTPMILAGDEFGNTQEGNNNPWCLDDETSWLKWPSQASDSQLLSYVKWLIAFRKAHKVISSREASDQFPAFSTHSDRAWYAAYEYNSRHIGLMFSAAGEYVYAGFNFHWDPQEFALPYLPEGYHWQTVAYTAPGSEGVNFSPERMLTLEGRSVCILTGVSDSECEDDSKS